MAQTLVQEFTTKKNQKQSTLARQLEISQSRLTQLFNNPEMLSEELLLKIINRLKEKTDFKIVGTANFTAVQSICKEAQQKHKLVAIIGYPGAGKTVGLDSYYRNSGNTYYMEAKNTMNRKQFFAKVLIELGVNFQGTVYDMVNAIANELNTRESPLLIIDEAGKINHNVLLDLHDLRNATIGNAGIVMAGCEYFHDNMRIAAQKQKQGIPEFYSRVQNWNELNPPTRKEIAAICQSNGVSDAEVIKEMQRIKNFRELYNSITNETTTDN
ncbi:ATP-binding protein [Flavipsychrobacter stenotrophus]|nr:ATP-binding protein [Flavipsychrobacter stenotrophus]